LGNLLVIEYELECTVLQRQQGVNTISALRLCVKLISDKRQEKAGIDGSCTEIDDLSLPADATFMREGVGMRPMITEASREKVVIVQGVLSSP